MTCVVLSTGEAYLHIGTLECSEFSLCCIQPNTGIFGPVQIRLLCVDENHLIVLILFFMCVGVCTSFTLIC